MTGLGEIAEAAGVSIATVSRVLNRRAGVNDQTRARVLEVVAQRPYRRRGLGALHRTGVIGLLVPELSNPVFPAFAEELETRAAQAGYSALLCNTRSAGIREEEYTRMLLGRGVEGMVFVCPDQADSSAARARYRKLRDDGVHIVFINSGAVSTEVPEIAVDQQAAGYTATRHLLNLGHQRIGFVCGPAHALPARLLQIGWTAALEEAGHPADPHLVAHGPFGADGGALAMSRLLDDAAPTGVICASDLMAMGAIREAARRGLTVPGDLSVVGFDDIALASYWSPPLTTLAQPIPAMAAATIDELVAGLDPDPRADHPPASRIFRAELVVRGSTAAPG